MSVATIPAKWCQCGCGELAPIAPQTHARHGWVRGQPMKYRRGHNSRSWPTWVETETGCWEWQGTIGHGYGTIKLEGRTVLAHRLMYELHVGPIPPRPACIDHLCRNRRCCNPAHLEIVTLAENSRRATRNPRPKRTRATRRHIARKLSIEAARDIRRVYAGGSVSYKQLAEQHGVSSAVVGGIVRGDIWVER